MSSIVSFNSRCLANSRKRPSHSEGFETVFCLEKTAVILKILSFVPRCVHILCMFCIRVAVTSKSGVPDDNIYFAKMSISEAMFYISPHNISHNRLRN